MVAAFTLLWGFLVSICLTGFLAHRHALRGEKTRSMLRADTQGDNPGVINRLWDAMRRELSKKPTRHIRLICCIALCLALFAFTRNPFIALLPWPATAAMPKLVRSYRERKSLARKEEQVLELIDSLNQSLRSGLSLQQSLQVSLQDVGEEAGREIMGALKDINLGSGLEEALRSAALRCRAPSLKLTFTVLALLHGKGGDLPRILERLRKRAAEGLEARREARVLTSQSRASGYLVSALPLVFLGLQAALNPGSLRPLFSTPTGNMIMAVAVGLNVAAFLLIRRIVGPEV